MQKSSAFPRLDAQAFLVNIESLPDLEKGWEPVLPFASSQPSFKNGLSSDRPSFSLYRPLIVRWTNKIFKFFGQKLDFLLAMCKVPLQYTAFPRLNAQAFSVKVGSPQDLEKWWEPVWLFASSRPSFTNCLSSINRVFIQVFFWTKIRFSLTMFKQVPLQYTVFPRLRRTDLLGKSRIPPGPGERVGARFTVHK